MKFLSLITLLIISYNIFAQSADLDKHSLPVSYVHLPDEPILEKSNRTFSSNKSSLVIEGFEKTNSSASLVLEFYNQGTIVDNVNVNKHRHEQKDKEGNVIKVTYSYDVTATYSTTANLTVTNNLISKTYTKEYAENDSYQSSSFTSYSKAQDYYNNNKYTIRDKYRNEHSNKMLSSARNFLNNNYGFYIVNKNFNLKLMGSKKHPEFAKHQELSLIHI